MKYAKILIPAAASALLFAGSALAADNPTTFKVNAVKFAAAPVIDGDLSDEAWDICTMSNSKVVIDYAAGGGRTAFPAIAYIGWDDKNIYAAYTVYSTNMSGLDAAGEGRDGSVWNDDEMELFIDPASGGSTFYQFCVNNLGVIYDHQNQDGSWNSDNIKVGIKKDSIKWTLEIALPFEDIGAHPKLNDIWNMNFSGHQKYPEDKWVSWTTADAFNNPEVFGAVKFVAADL